MLRAVVAIAVVSLSAGLALPAHADPGPVPDAPVTSGDAEPFVSVTAAGWQHGRLAVTTKLAVLTGAHRQTVRVVGLGWRGKRVGAAAQLELPDPAMHGGSGRVVSRFTLSFPDALADRLRRSPSLTVAVSQQSRPNASGRYTTSAVGNRWLVGRSPLGAKSCQGRSIGPHADLRGCDLTAAPLAGSDLHGARFGPVTPGTPDVTTWQPSRHARANGRGAVLTGADLRQADLRNAQLSRVVGWHADLRGADLRRSQAVLGGFEGTRAQGSRWQGADLRHAQLWAADLRNSAFAAADLRDAELGGADVAGADWRAANLAEATWIDASKCARHARLGACGSADPVTRAWSSDIAIPTDASEWVYHSIVVDPTDASRYVGRYDVPKQGLDTADGQYIYSLPAAALVAGYSTYHLQLATDADGITLHTATPILDE